MAVSEAELAFRRRQYEAHRDRLKADGEQYRHAGKRLLTTAISLQGSPDEVAESVEELAARISRRVGGELSLASRLVA